MLPVASNEAGSLIKHSHASALMSAQRDRTSARRHVFKGAKIIINGATLDCTLRCISDGGAQLSLASVIGIPDLFELWLPHEPVRRCRLIWRMPQQIGIAFI
jgi:hypothetical protein